MDYREIEDYTNYLIYKNGKIYSKKSEIFMKPTLQTNKKNGRQDMVIDLCKNGKPKHFLLARLLGIAFIYNDDPINKIQIDHFDRNSLNNDLSNLRWVTLEEQARNKGIYNNNKLGLRYIIKTKNNSYRVQIGRHKYYKCFKTIEEAILQRNSFLESIGEEYENIDV